MMRYTADERTKRMVALIQREAYDTFKATYPDLSSLAPVTVLITAYMEEANIGAVLERIPPTIHSMKIDTLVIVDGGDDATAKISKEYGAFTCVLPTNLGQGAALRLGYRIALEYDAQYIVTIDADGQNDPMEMGALLEPILAQEADLVIGSRRLGKDLTSDPIRKAGVVFFAYLTSLITRTRLTDTSNGFRAMTAKLLADIHLEQDQYQTAELLISAALRGWRVAEVPVTWKPRLSGSSKKGSNLTFGLNYAAVIAKTWLRDH